MKIYSHKFFKYNKKNKTIETYWCDVIVRLDNDPNITIVRLRNNKKIEVITKLLTPNYDKISV